MNKTDGKVVGYWTERAHDFASVRRSELSDALSERWLCEIEKRLPEGKRLRVLDVGTGTGYFAVLLSRLGHEVTGIDLTPAMLTEAERLAADYGVTARFETGDAQELSFADGSFDLVISRNLTWTLPDPKKAYGEWLRVLRPGGVLLNFDASYADNVRNNQSSGAHLPADGVYGHVGMTDRLERENAEITLMMPLTLQDRPSWDIGCLTSLGVCDCGFDRAVGRRILGDRDLADAPMFLVWGIKS